MAQDVTIDIKFKILEDINKKVGKIEQSFKGLENQTNRAGAAFKKLGVTIAAVFGARQLFNFLKDSLLGFAQFEKSVIEITTILPKAQGNVKKLQKELSNLSVEFGTNRIDQAKGLYQTISSGFIDAAEAAKILRSANVLALGGLTDIKTAVDGLTSVLKSYGLTGSDAAGVTDILFQTIKNARTTAEELGNSLSVITGLGATVGVTFQELAAALGTITLNGTDTATAAVQLRQILASILKPTTEAAEEARRLGIQFNVAAIRSKGLGKFLLDLRNRINGSEESTSKLFGNIRALAGIIQLTNGDLSDYNRLLKDNQNAAGAAADAAKKMKEAFFVKLDVILARWQKFKDFIGRILVNAIYAAIEAYDLLTGSFKDDSLPNIKSTLQKVNDEIKNFKPDIIDVGGFLQEDYSRLSILKSQREELEKQLSTMGKIASKTKESTKAIVAPTLSSAKQGSQTAPVKVELMPSLGAGGKVYGPGSEAGIKEFKMQTDALFRLNDYMKKLTLGGVASAVGQGAAGAKSLVSGALNTVMPGAGQVFEFFSMGAAQFREALDGFIDFFINLPTTLAENASYFIQRVVEKLPEINNALIEAMPILVSSLSKLLTDPKFWKSVAETLVKQTLQTWTFGMLDSFKPITDAFSSAVNFFKDVVDSLKSVVSGGAFKSAGKGVGNVFKSIGKAFGFAEGGDVPNLAQYRNDNFPARLSAGESVLTKSTTDMLRDFLTSSGGSQPININLTIGENQLASVLFDLNRKGFRTA